MALPKASSLVLVPHALEMVLSNVTDFNDRNSCSLVCLEFRAAERQTRQQLRLRCTRSRLEQTPLCFSEVRSLDLSSVVPRVTSFELSRSQLHHLGACFPQVRTLTLFSDGCHDWVNRGNLPFKEVWPFLETIIIQEPEPVEAMRRGPSPVWACLGGSQIGLSPLKLAVPGPGLGFALRGVSLKGVSNKELLAFGKTRGAILEALTIELPSQARVSLDYSLLSSNVFPSLKKLSIQDPWDETVEPTSRNRKPALGESLKLPDVTNLSLQLSTAVTAALADMVPTKLLAGSSLRSLHLEFSPQVNLDEPYWPMAMESLFGCKELEKLELVGDSRDFDDNHLRSIFSAIEGSQKLRILHLFRLGGLDNKEDRSLVNNLLEHIAENAPLLTEFDTDLPMDFTSMPVRGRLRRFGCTIDPSVGSQPWAQVSGWNSLEELKFRSNSVAFRISIDCPSLKKVVLARGSRCRGLRVWFMGGHQGLAEVRLVALIAGSARGERAEHCREQLGKMIEALKCLKNLTTLFVKTTTYGTFWDNPFLVKAIGTLPNLRTLCIDTSNSDDGPQGVHTYQFDELLPLRTLEEVQVPYTWGTGLLGFYERFYKH